MSLEKEDNILKTRISDLVLKNPVLAASGTFGYGEEYNQLFEVVSLGGVITKTITLEPRPGNPSPRIIETSCGVLNSIGLQNPGVEDFIRDKLPWLKKLNAAIIVSIGGNEPDEFRSIAHRLEKIEGIDAYEINLSCPNIIYDLTTGVIGDGKFLIAQDVYLTFEVVRAVRKITKRPIIPKLSPNVTDIVSIARSCYDAGADALTIANTYLGMVVDSKTKSPIFENIIGGLSGPAIKPLTLRLVWEVSQEMDLPIIASGGVMNSKDAIEYIITGAKAVAVGTGIIVDPKAPQEIIKGIREYLIKNSINSVEELSGSIKI